MDTPARYPALVLAGKRREDDPVAKYKGVSHKAIAIIGGRPMIAHVLEALAESAWIGDIFISTADVEAFRARSDIVAYAPASHITEAAGSICESVQRAVARGDVKPPFFVITADHALLTADMIEHFWRVAQQAMTKESADFALAFVPRKIIKAAYPDTRRTYLEFRDDGYSGCNMYGFLTTKSLKILHFWREVESKRKKPLDLVRAFGFSNLIRYVLRLHTVDDMLARAGRVVSARPVVIKMPWAEAAIDVDKISDVVIVEDILARRKGI